MTAEDDAGPDLGAARDVDGAAVLEGADPQVDRDVDGNLDADLDADLVGRLIDASTVVVCCGSGGVGKTTSAAVIGIEAAARGRRAVVVTIDPARRLADALGLADGLDSRPTRIALGGGFADPPDDSGAAEGPRAVEGSHTVERDDPAERGDTGELWAMMLDTSSTFDGLVRRHAADDDQAERILSNPLYRNMAGAMSGTQEYMAAETLHELHGDDRFDLVIVDTPPSRNALDFLEAPGVLARFLDHRVFKLMMLPTKSGLRLLGPASQPILKAIGRVVGSDVLADSVAFFQAFAGMESGFRERAEEVVDLIRAPSTRFVLVASPRRDTIEEAVWFARQLDEQRVGAAAAIVNRAQPVFGDGDVSAAEQCAAVADDPVLSALWTNLAELAMIGRRQREVVSPLAELLGADAIVEVPLLDGDVHDLAGLREIGRHLFRSR